MVAGYHGNWENALKMAKSMFAPAKKYEGMLNITG